jgi:hypothetical protein
MPVDTSTKQLLAKWLALSQAGALQRAKSMVWTLWIFSGIVAMLVVVAIANRADPVWVAVGAAAVGWLIAETNALRTRIAQWSTFRRYLDWKRIEQDLEDAT